MCPIKPGERFVLVLDTVADLMLRPTTLFVSELFLKLRWCPFFGLIKRRDLFKLVVVLPKFHLEHLLNRVESESLYPLYREVCKCDNSSRTSVKTSL